MPNRQHRSAQYESENEEIDIPEYGSEDSDGEGDENGGALTPETPAVTVPSFLLPSPAEWDTREAFNEVGRFGSVDLIEVGLTSTACIHSMSRNPNYPLERPTSWSAS